jgi:hypothetical protein
MRRGGDVMTARIVDGGRLPLDIDQALDAIVDGGYATEAEAEATIAFLSMLADRELAGELLREAALREVIEFGLMQMASRSEVKS